MVSYEQQWTEQPAEASDSELLAHRFMCRATSPYIEENKGIVYKTDVICAYPILVKLAWEYLHLRDTITVGFLTKKAEM